MASSDSDEASQLHTQFLNGDPTAFARIAEQFLKPLVESFKRRFFALDPHWIETAVDDALLDYFQHPEKFDAAKRSLRGYLYMSAHGDLLNTIEREKFPQNFVELDAVDTEYTTEILDDAAWEQEIWVRLSPAWERVRTLLTDPMDEEIVVLMMDGERDTIEYARVLGLGDRSVKEQEMVVKRHKDRLKVFLRRHLDQSELRDYE